MMSKMGEIIGMPYTNETAVGVLNDPAVLKYLCRPNVTYRIYSGGWFKWSTYDKKDHLIECFRSHEGDWEQYYVVVRVSGQSLRTMRWECHCGSKTGVDVIPCKHALLAWGSTSVRKAKLVVNLAKRMLRNQRRVGMR